MISEQQALALLDKYRLPQERIEHSRGVAAFAFNMATAIAKRHPELRVDPDKVKIAALLHDIGRSREGDHELNSVSILREEGLGAYADIVMHGTLYEAMLLRGETRPELKPLTLENKIVAYADTRFRLAPVTLRERMDEIALRRGNEPEKMAALKMAAARYFNLEKELMDLIG